MIIINSSNIKQVCIMYYACTFRIYCIYCVPHDWSFDINNDDHIIKRGISLHYYFMMLQVKYCITLNLVMILKITWMLHLSYWYGTTIVDGAIIMSKWKLEKKEKGSYKPIILSNYQHFQSLFIRTARFLSVCIGLIK